MKIFEIGLVLLVLPTLLRPFAPAVRMPRWIDFFPAAALLLAVISFFIERYPFRLYPAYFLIVLVFLFSLPRLLQPAAGTTKRRFMHILGAVFGLLLWLVALALPFALPMQWIDPTGPYTVGTVTYEWTDTARPETYSDDPADFRRLAVQFWYPSDQPHAPFNKDLAGAKLSSAESGYPLVIFSHGATGVRISNSTNYRELASHGYIVASVDHTYLNMFTRFSDGQLVTISPRYQKSLSWALEGDPEGEAEMLAMYQVRAEDVIFVIDQVERINREGTPELPAGSIDLQRVGIFGHSAGGATAGMVCRVDPRCKAALVLDGTMVGEVVERKPDFSETYTTEPFPTPLMQINNGHLYRDLPEAYAANLSAYHNAILPAYNLVVDGAEHLNLTDLQLLAARPVFRLFGEQQVALGPVDPMASARMLNAYVLAFFDETLKGRPSPLLDGPSSAYPFVTFESRN